MDSSELLGLFRTELADNEDPPLWDDDEVFDYIDDAQKMFCRLVGGIKDVTSTFTRIALADVLTSGLNYVVTSPLILYYRLAYRLSDGLPVEIANYERLVSEGFRFDNKAASRLDYLIAGIEDSKLFIYPVPAADPAPTDTIQLWVERLPLVTISTTKQPLEIDPQHHRHLLLWVKHLAYSKQDADTYDAKKSIDFEEKFEAYCRRAKLEKERKENTPRLMAYGGPAVGISTETGYGFRGRSCRSW